MAPTFAILLPFALTAAILLPAAGSSARPERITPGTPYYDDDYSCVKQICDLAAESNYEEVYQLYSYYEAQYDEAERVIRFIEYRKGEKIRTEEYRYDGTGKPLHKKVTRGGGQVEIIDLGSEAEQGDGPPGPV